MWDILPVNIHVQQDHIHSVNVPSLNAGLPALRGDGVSVEQQLDGNCDAGR